MLVLPLAPGGHPLFAAIEDARELVAFLREQRAMIPSLPSGARIPSMVAAAIEAIRAAAASVRVDPDKPLPRTIWAQLGQIPTPLMVAGLGVVVLLGYAAGRR